MNEAKAPTELVLVSALRPWRGPDGGLVVTRKYMNGAAEYARHWPGPVTNLFKPGTRPSTDMDQVELRPGEERTGVEVYPDTRAALARRLSSAALVVDFLARDARPLVDLCNEIGVPVVVVSEYSPRTERQILRAEVSNPVIRLRRHVWLWRTERIRRAILPRVAGLQCSGTPTYDLYRHLCRDTILFFDNRVPASEIIGEAALAGRLEALRSGAPLRLVFGGRLIGMKGVMDLPDVAAALARAGVPFRLDIYGSGPLKAPLAARIGALGLSDRVRMHGALDFHTGWIPTLRDRADLFLCCHPQGDPSSTYIEVMSCGVPIVGYDNEAFRGILAHSDAGWHTPIHDIDAIAGQIARLHGAREQIAEAARRARSFASRHVFETTFANRTAHMIRNSRLPEPMRHTALAQAGP